MPPFAGMEARWSQSWRRVSMGEGLSPLVPLDLSDHETLVKLDYALHTLSFKDRGAAGLVAAAAAGGARPLAQASAATAGDSRTA